MPEVMAEFDEEVEDGMWELQNEMFAGYLVNPKYVRFPGVCTAPSLLFA